MKIPGFFNFPRTAGISRQDKCVFCASSEGVLVGRINYIGLADFDMVQCTTCGLISTDPIPSSEIVAQGCSRLYQLQPPSEKRSTIFRGFSKSLRRGAKFARVYLQNERAKNSGLTILEVGAGDGYFSEGIRREIPESEITLIDIVPELAWYYENQFPCKTKIGEFTSHLFSNNEKFDLVIFRDLLEHVRDPFAFLKHAKDVLKPTGKIFFITPNGREDFWMINQRWINDKQPTLLMLNHFHYFLPETLVEMLRVAGFDMDTAFKWGLKHHKKGLGWKQFTNNPPLAIPEFQTTSPQESFVHTWRHDSSEVSSSLINNLGLFSRVYSFFLDRESPVVPFSSPKGHEFFVIAKKQQA
jgi:SAM-dependent methyltransferase